MKLALFFLFTSLFLDHIQGRVVIYLSPSGINTSMCGASPSSSCRNLAFAYSSGQGKDSTDPKDMFLVNGDYVETATLTVEGTLNIYGQSETGCRLKKTTGHACFIFTSGAILTFTSLTVLTINDSNFYNFVRLETNANVTFISCHMTRDFESATSNRGSSFFFQNTASGVFGLSSCTVYSISGDGGVFIETNNSMESVWFQDSSFANMRHSGTENYSSVFRLHGVAGIIIVRCLFVMCFSNSSSVGSIIPTTEGCSIQSCTFLNNTASYSYGTVRFRSSTSFRAHVDIVNTTCMRCTVTTHNGGCFHIDEYVNASLERCAFTECKAGNNGGAIFVRNSEMFVGWCHFTKCTARGGGAILGESNAKVNVSNSMFLNSGIDKLYSGVTFTFSDSYCGGTPCNTPTRINLNDPSSTCDSVFPTDSIKPSCPQPCVSSPDSSSSPACLYTCPEDFIATGAGGVCVPRCSFYPPQIDTCNGTCEVTTNAGLQLCAHTQPCEPLDGGDRSHYVLVAGLCRLKACAERIPVFHTSSSLSTSASLSYPCGGSSADRCYYDSAARVCVESCAEDVLHTGTVSNIDKECTLRSCTARLYNSSSIYACGSNDCFYEEFSQRCTVTCATNHSTIDTVAGRCVLKNCTARVRNESTTFPCGSSDCFYDALSQQCTVTCPSNHFTEDPGTGQCVEKDCTARVRNASSTLPCGSSDCFYDPVAPAVQGRQCVTACPDDSHHTGESTADAMCSLRECYRRGVNISAQYPCATRDCIYDPQNTESPCGVSCADSSQYKPSYAEGVCVRKMCAELGGKDVCVAQGEGVCHYRESKGECEDTKKYKSRTTLIIVLSGVFGGIGMIIIIIISVFVCKKGYLIYKENEKEEREKKRKKREREVEEEAKRKEMEMLEMQKEMSGIQSSYIFKQSLGVGSFGEVFLAEHKKTGEAFAVKVIQFNPRGDEAQGHMGISAVEAEMNIGMEMSKKCPYLISYKEVNLQAHIGKCYIAMEYCAGGDLRTRIDRRITAKLNFEEEELRRFVREIGTAIEALHSENIIHRDIKPENIFLTSKDTYKLGDYGTARLLNRKQTMTVIGTQGYIPPEILQDQGDYSTKMDIYSFGCVLLEMIALHHPFKNERNGLDFVAVSFGRTNIVSPTNCSTELLQLANQMISVDPSRRPSIEDILKVL